MPTSMNRTDGAMESFKVVVTSFIVSRAVLAVQYLVSESSYP